MARAVVTSHFRSVFDVASHLSVITGSHRSVELFDEISRVAARPSGHQGVIPWMLKASS